MKKKYFLNANIVDPQNSLEELGGLIVDENGKIEAIGKKVNKNNIPSREKFIDLKEKYIFPGIVDMRVFVGEPGFEYKENFRTLSNAALAGGVTSVVTMPNTSPVIDNVSIVDFLKRRGRDKSKINVLPTATLTKNLEGTNMTEFGLLKGKGIVGFTDGLKTEIQVNPEFTLDEATVEANKYAFLIGQLPTALRKDVETMWIHKGIEAYGGGNRNLLVHTGMTESYEKNLTGNITEETLIHEATHTSIDSYHYPNGGWTNSGYSEGEGWIEAVENDGCYISTYAKDFPYREDLAELMHLYLSLIHI